MTQSTRSYTFIKWGLLGLLSVLGLTFGIIMMNKVDPLPDSRYSALSLDIEYPPVSESLMNFVEMSHFKEEEKEIIKKGIKHIIFEDDSSNEAKSAKDSNQISFGSFFPKLTPLLVEQSKKLENTLNEEGCLDMSVSIRNKHAFLPKFDHLTNILNTTSLASLYLASSPPNQHPDYLFDTYFPLLQKLENKMLSCHHYLTVFVTFKLAINRLSYGLLSLFKDARFSLELQETLINHLSKPLRPVLFGLQNALRIDHKQEKTFLTQNLTEGYNSSKKSLFESIESMRPFFDLQQLLRWSDEYMRATLWMVMQPVRQPRPDDLEIDRFSAQLFPSFFSYNSVGIVLFKVAQTNLIKFRDQLYIDHCRLLYELSKTMKLYSKSKILPPLNPITQKAYTLQKTPINRKDQESFINNSNTSKTASSPPSQRSKRIPPSQCSL